MLHLASILTASSVAVAAAVLVSAVPAAAALRLCAGRPPHVDRADEGSPCAAVPLRVRAFNALWLAQELEVTGFFAIVLMSRARKAVSAAELLGRVILFAKILVFSLFCYLDWRYGAGFLLLCLGECALLLRFHGGGHHLRAQQFLLVSSRSCVPQ